MRRRLALLAAAAAVCLTACGAANGFSDGELLSRDVKGSADSSVTYRYSPATEPPAAYNSFSNTVTGFTLKLYRRAYADGVTAAAPVNSVLQLGLLANGAKGDTRTELLMALGAELDADSLNACCSYFKSRMNTVGAQDGEAPLTLGGALFLNDRTDVRSAFLRVNADYYGDDIIRYDFAKGADKLKAYLGDRITLTADDSMVSYSDLRLTDSWLTPSLDAEEYVMDSGTAHGVIKYTANTPLKALWVFPDKGSLDDYVKTFDSVEYNRLLESVDVTKRESVSLPSFQTAAATTELSPILTQIGLYTLFGDDSDFGNLTHSGDLRLNAVYDSVPALSVTARGVGTDAATPDSAQSAADEPFLFLLTDNETDIPLYIAAVT